MNKLKLKNYTKADISSAIGVTNQRETIVAWNKQTGIVVI